MLTSICITRMFGELGVGVMDHVLLDGYPCPSKSLLHPVRIGPWDCFSQTNKEHDFELRGKFKISHGA